MERGSVWCCRNALCMTDRALVLALLAVWARDHKHLGGWLEMWTQYLTFSLLSHPSWDVLVQHWSAWVCCGFLFVLMSMLGGSR